MRLALSPLTGRERKDLQIGIREIFVYPTVLLYRIAGDRVEIVRMVDGRRDVAALFERE